MSTYVCQVQGWGDGAEAFVVGHPRSRWHLLGSGLDFISSFRWNHLQGLPHTTQTGKNLWDSPSCQINSFLWHVYNLRTRTESFHGALPPGRNVTSTDQTTAGTAGIFGECKIEHKDKDMFSEALWNVFSFSALQRFLFIWLFIYLFHIFWACPVLGTRNARMNIFYFLFLRSFQWCGEK
jgi:hypothetical protein